MKWGNFWNRCFANDANTPIVDRLESRTKRRELFYKLVSQLKEVASAADSFVKNIEPLLQLENDQELRERLQKEYQTYIEERKINIQRLSEISKAYEEEELKKGRRVTIND